MIKKLEWDSEFFNIPIYDLHRGGIDNGEFLKNIDYGLVQCKLNIGEYKLIEELIKKNFSIEGAGITYVKKIHMSCDSEIEIATEKESSVIKKIASNRLSNTRFHDKFFGKGSADRLYKYWAFVSVKGGYDDCCLVVRNTKGAVAGFATVKKVKDCLNIGLIATSIKEKEKGFGKKLMKQVETYALNKNISKVMVTTQYNNEVARKMYKSMGYNISHEFYWLYLKVGF